MSANIFLRNTPEIDRFMKCTGDLAILSPFTINYDEELGRGGYGKVFAGTIRQNRTVAVKVLLHARDFSVEQQFRREYKCLEILGQHGGDNFVKVFGYKQTNDPDYRKCMYAMEKADASLAQMLSYYTNGLPYRYTMSLVADTGRAFAKMHELCINHTDMTPGNILAVGDTTNRSGVRWLLSDFGHVRVSLHQESCTVPTAGTTTEMHPIQLATIYGEDVRDLYSGVSSSGKELKIPTQMLELWAISCIIYYAVTGRKFIVTDTYNKGWLQTIRMLLKVKRKTVIGYNMNEKRFITELCNPEYPKWLLHALTQVIYVAQRAHELKLRTSQEYEEFSEFIRNCNPTEICCPQSCRQTCYTDMPKHECKNFPRLYERIAKGYPTLSQEVFGSWQPQLCYAFVSQVREHENYIIRECKVLQFNKIVWSPAVESIIAFQDSSDDLDAIPPTDLLQREETIERCYCHILAALSLLEETLYSNTAVGIENMINRTQTQLTKIARDNLVAQTPLVSALTLKLARHRKNLMLTHSDVNVIIKKIVEFQNAKFQLPGNVREKFNEAVRKVPRPARNANGNEPLNERQREVWEKDLMVMQELLNEKTRSYLVVSQRAQALFRDSLAVYTSIDAMRPEIEADVAQAENPFTKGIEIVPLLPQHQLTSWGIQDLYSSMSNLKSVIQRNLDEFF